MTREDISKIIEESMDKAVKGQISLQVAKMAVKGSLDELVSGYRDKLEKKDEQIDGLKKALRLADSQREELEKKQREGLKEAIAKKEAKGEPKKEEPKKKNYREKKCKICGKPFIPNSGVQTTCDKCKDKVSGKSEVARDISETAKELAGMQWGK